MYLFYQFNQYFAVFLIEVLEYYVYNQIFDYSKHFKILKILAAVLVI